MAEHDGSSEPGGRPAGLALIVLAAATLILLMNHPDGSAQSFAEVLRDEAAHRVVDGVVHGGFIAVLGAELACLAILAMRIGRHRAWALAGLALWATGAAFLMLSMLLDGLVVPSIAARYAALLPDKQNEARILFVLLGTLVGFLMPVALAFQAAGLACWSAALLRYDRLARMAGIFGIGVAAAALVGLALTAGTSPHVLIATLLCIAAWDALVGVALLRRQI